MWAQYTLLFSLHRFKPMQVTQFLGPVREEFEQLFHSTFSMKQNAQFLSSLQVRNWISQRKLQDFLGNYEFILRFIFTYCMVKYNSQLASGIQLKLCILDSNPKQLSRSTIKLAIQIEKSLSQSIAELLIWGWYWDNNCFQLESRIHSFVRIHTVIYCSPWSWKIR